MLDVAITPMKRALIICALLLLFPATVEALTRHTHRRLRASSPPIAIAAGDLAGCLDGTLRDPGPMMKSLNATILRVVISRPYGVQGEALPCISGAHAEGYKVELAIQWTSTWPLWRTKRLFKQVLTLYAPYVWAVVIGNEQEIAPRLTSAGYARAWRALVPIVKRITPHAIRVGGDISPWGLPFLKRALRYGLPGIQALAVHPYAYAWAFTIPQALRLARSWGLPLWCDEGLFDGPHTWHPRRTLPLSAMRGVAVAGVWVA
jgi:hypothetical protein